MKSQFRSAILFLGLITILASCQSKNKRVANLAPGAHQVVAEEVLQTSGYSYVRVAEGDSSYWLAINKAEIVVGATYFWSHGAPMFDFFSKELKRKFPKVYFIDDFTNQPITADKANDQRGAALQAAQMRGKQPVAEKEGLVVPRAEGGITIGELYTNRAKYAGKTVTIRGEVEKFSAAIMNKNWMHIQDGTKYGEIYDLTVTSKDSAKVGDVVVFQGAISVNKDFGAGYTYEVIMEDAKIIKK